MPLESLNPIYREMYLDVAIKTWQQQEFWDMEEEIGTYPALIASRYMFLDRHHEIKKACVEFPPRPFHN